jgi:peptidoglycan/xylan/chitin deacetylase (PgdA/CDA1 family)
VPPYGATDEATVKGAKEAGFDTVLWDIDPQDWRNPSPSAMANTTIATLRSGDVILMHDGGGDRAQTVTLLRTILDHLKAKGIAARPLCR